LFLCSNQVTLQHPYYNTPVGREEFDAMGLGEGPANGIWKADDGTVMVTVAIPLPNKFESFMTREQARYDTFGNE
jgi:hypothetical protein